MLRFYERAARRMEGRMAEHRFAVTARWEGNRGQGTADYRAYGRQVALEIPGDAGAVPPPIAASAARPFRGDPDRWNPEQLLVAALAECHLLSYLHVAARNGIRVEAYSDDADGEMEQIGDGGRFTRVTLRPLVTISQGDPALALALHDEAAELCFIASSVAFPVEHEPSIVLAEDPLGE